MTPAVSVVVPTYNSVDFIDATMRSILTQTFTDFEVVVSDHSSTDGTWEALQHYTADPRVRLSRLAHGGGAPANWNAVTDLASGEFLKLVHGDDVLYPDCLALQVAALRAHPSAVLASSTRDIIDAKGAPVLRDRGMRRLRGEVSGTEAIRRAVLAGKHFGEPVAVLFRRQVLEDVGGWDARFPFEIDMATCCAVLLRGNLVAVPGPLAAWRVHSSQWSLDLMHSHVEQTVGLYRELAATHPGLLGPRHLLVAAIQARINVLGRRAVYLWLDRRTRARTPAKCG